GLEAHLALWKPTPHTEGAEPSSRRLNPGIPGSAQSLPIGYILSLEGADSILSLKHLERSYADGLRAIGLAHYGPGIYAHGTDDQGPLPPKGRELLKEIERLGLILDVTHLCDE